MRRYSRRNLFFCAGVILLGLILSILPVLIGLGWMEGGIALSALGVFVVLLGVIALLLYLRLARAVENLLNKENVQARWNFTSEQWQSYLGNEPPDSAEDWKVLFALVSILAAILGLVFWLVTRSSVWVIVLTVLGIILLSLPIARVYVQSSRRPADKGGGEVVVSLDGVSINRHIHLWKGIGNRLEKAALEERGGDRDLLIFEYSAPSNSGREYYVARVPVPPGQQEMAGKILAEISARHLAVKPSRAPGGAVEA